MAAKIFLEKGGEMGSLIRAYDWDSTSIFNPDKWSQSHLSAIHTILSSRFPMLVFWGKDLITFYNDAFRPSLGNDGKHPQSLGQPGHQSWSESWPVIGPMIENIMSGGDAVWFEDQKLPLYRDGHITYAYWTYSFSPLLDDDGTVGGILVTCNETTKAVESLMHLKEKEEQLQMAIVSADLGTWYINAKTREFLPSPRLKEMFGFRSDEDMPYDAAINQIADTHRTAVSNAVEDALSKGLAYDLEYPIIGFRDNKLRWVRATGRLFNDSDGNPVHFSGAISDITVRKEEDQRREDFLSIASHELKSPLTALKGYLQIMNAKAHTLAN
ncbi:MAG: PAS domain S-box protein, partial [Pedobacter sp.]